MLVVLKNKEVVQVQKVANVYLELRRDDKPGRWLEWEDIELVIDKED